MSNITSLFQQSVSAHQTGDLVAAANGYAKVLTAQPDNSDAWHFAGILAYQKGRPADALNQIQFAIDLNPNNAEYFSNLSLILLGIGQLGPAIDAADQAISIDSDFHAAHFQKGKALSHTNRLSEAEQSFEEAIRRGGDELTISIELIKVLQIQGLITEAIERLKSILKKNPEYPYTYIELAKFVSTGQFNFDDGMISQMKRLEGDSKRCAAGARVRLQAAIATHYQSRKQFDSAFEYFSSSNRLMSLLNSETKRVHFDCDEHAKFTNKIIEYFDAATVQTMQSRGNLTLTPVFVIGMPRSGTTLIHQLLSYHSKVAGVGELNAIGDLFSEQIMQIGVDSKPSQSTQDDWAMIDENIVLNGSDRYLSLIEEKLRETGNQGASRSIDKMPGNYNYVGFIKTLFPNAKFIHCVRDPRDVCLSCFFTLFTNARLQAATSNLENVAEMFWTYRRLMEHWELLFGESIYHLDYRNMVNQPDIEMGAILEFLQLPFEECCTKIASKKAPLIRTASIAQARSPIYKSSLERWKRYEKHLSAITNRLADEIEAYTKGRIN